MYWNQEGEPPKYQAASLNSNIRCIEIYSRRTVLLCPVLLNSNIRCIEIHASVYSSVQLRKLNSNIRCIEMQLQRKHAAGDIGWIVTLDVLKYSYKISNLNFFWLNSNIRCIEISHCCSCCQCAIGWIVTLDVLKLYLSGFPQLS